MFTPGFVKQVKMVLSVSQNKCIFLRPFLNVHKSNCEFSIKIK